jgi:hypothetical protein
MPLLPEEAERGPSDLVARLVAFKGGPNGLLLGRLEKIRAHRGQGVSWVEGPRRIAWRDACDWWVQVRDAVERAGLPPETTLYSLRHFRIQEMLLEGVPAAVVARSLDTSVAVIEAFYAKYIAKRDEAVAMLRRALRRKAA